MKGSNQGTLKMDAKLTVNSNIELKKNNISINSKKINSSINFDLKDNKSENENNKRSLINIQQNPTES